MKTPTPFQKLIEKVKQDHPKLKERSVQSLQWYNKKIQNEFGKKTQSPLNVYQTQTKKLLPFVGQLITFKYTPKLKQELPFYDVFPLILTLSIDSKSILGLNFHYIKPLHRIMFMSELYKYVGKRFDNPVIRVDYDKLLSTEALRFYRPCLKRYLFNNISQQISIIPQEEWELALFLPTGNFISNVGKTTNAEKIWEQSATLIRKK